MEQKNYPGREPGESFSGKGLYIALLLCAALSAAAVMLMLPEEETMDEPQSGETQMTMATLPAPTSKPERVQSEAPRVQPETAPALAAPTEKSGEELTEEKAEETVEQLPLYFIWPVSGILERDYSREELSYDQTMGDWRTHEGWDIAAALGGHVLSAADGTVSRIYEDDLYGTTVEISHGCGVVSCYANLAAVPTVKVGDSVRVGDVIGAVGDTALCETGESYHLHFAMKLNGVTADPANWLPER